MKNLQTVTTIGVLALSLAVPAAAQDFHPAMDSKVWVNVGAFFAQRNFEASAKASVPGIALKVDFEKVLGLDDNPELGIAEFGWQFGTKWALATQFFRANRENRWSLRETVEWEDLVFDIGAEVRAGTDFEVTRFVLSRQFRDNGPHSLRLVGGFHYLEFGAFLAGEVSLDNETAEFRRSAVSASAPVPNLGVWYRYSPSNRWLATARIDWLSADVGDYSGSIWNIAVGANYALGKRAGIGLAYQFFNISGAVREDLWRGDVDVRFSGPNLHLSLFW